VTVAAHLSTLEAVGLIRLAQAQPELEYLFRHTLVQEVAYDSLVKADRQTLHLAAGRALEYLYPERRETGSLATVLARHYHEAGDDARALHYFTRAGDAAAQVYAIAEAVAHYTQALELAQRVLPPVSRDRLLHLFVQRGRSLELAGRFEEAEADYRDLEALGERQGEQRLVLEGLIRRATLYVVPTDRMDAAQGTALANQALELARELGDRPAEARSLWNLALAAKFVGRFEASLEHGEQTIAISRELGLREQLALTLNDIYPGYLVAGQPQRALAALEEAQGLWRELGNLPLLADTLTNTGQIYLLQADMERATRLIEEALRISRSIGNARGQAYSLLILSTGRVEQGEWGPALAIIDEAAGVADKAGFMMAQLFGPAMQAQLYGLLGDVPRGLALARRALAQAGGANQYGRATVLGTLALLHLIDGDIEQAEQYEAEAWRAAGDVTTDETLLLEIIRGDLMLAKGENAALANLAEGQLRDLDRYGILLYRPDVLRYKGVAQLGLGQVDEARAALEEGRALAARFGLRRPLLLLLLALIRLEGEAGDAERQAAYRGEASQIIQEIAAGVEDLALRQKFLARGDLREALYDH
jgi:tetratricopeptide (TPR) repeat protein